MAPPETIDGAELEHVLSFIEENIRTIPLKELLFQVSSKGRKLPKELVHSINKATSELAGPRRESIPRFVVVSGPDRSGKETQCFNRRHFNEITGLNKFLVNQGYSVLGISLPSYHTTLGSVVSAYLNHPKAIWKFHGEISKEHAWLLWSLDRAQHNSRILKWTAKSAKHVVLSKQWLESNITYQKNQGLDERRILAFEDSIVKQSHTIILDAPITTIKERLRGRSRDRYEQPKILQKVRELYLMLPQLYPYGDFYLVDASREMREVNLDLIQLTKRLISSNFSLKKSNTDHYFANDVVPYT